MRSLVCGCKQMQKPSSKINMVKRSKNSISSVTNMMRHYNHCQLRFMIETLSLSLALFESIYIYIYNTHAIIKTTEDIIYLPKSVALHCQLVSSVGSLTMPVGLGCVPGQRIGNSSTLVLAPHLGPRVVVEMHHGKLADFFWGKLSHPMGCEKRTFRLSIADGLVFAGDISI